LTFSCCYDKNVTPAGLNGGSVKTAVIILSHGSRSGNADRAIRKVVEELRNIGGRMDVEHAFLQYVPPTLQEVLERCIGKKADRIVIVPFFLQEGTHVIRDIPELVHLARKQNPSVTIVVTDYVGAHPLMARIVEDLVKQQV
jgi:sirohydrochlorin ferrochelatase